MIKGLTLAAAAMAVQLTGDDEFVMIGTRAEARALIMCDAERKHGEITE